MDKMEQQSHRTNWLTRDKWNEWTRWSNRATGPTGIPGTNGTNGQDGATGATGATGSTGVTDPPGSGLNSLIAFQPFTGNVAHVVVEGSYKSGIDVNENNNLDSSEVTSNNQFVMVMMG